MVRGAQEQASSLRTQASDALDRAKAAASEVNLHVRTGATRLFENLKGRSLSMVCTCTHACARVMTAPAPETFIGLKSTAAGGLGLPF